MHDCSKIANLNDWICLANLVIYEALSRASLLLDYPRSRPRRRSRKGNQALQISAVTDSGDSSKSGPYTIHPRWRFRAPSAHTYMTNRKTHKRLIFQISFRVSVANRLCGYACELCLLDTFFSAERRTCLVNACNYGWSLGKERLGSPSIAGNALQEVCVCVSEEPREVAEVACFVSFSLTAVRCRVLVVNQKIGAKFTD